jgi:hypothetical protein
MESQQVDKAIEEYKAHLLSTAATFNASAEENALPVRMNPEKAIMAIDMGIGLAEVAHYWSLRDEFGIVHETQIKTAVECFVKIMNDSTQRGHIVGAMQSGKTTTSLALQWVGPILYLLKGLRVYPFYIIGSQTGHEDQTNTELERFFKYYGNIEFAVTAGATTPVGILSLFERAPSLSNYRQHVLAAAEEDVLGVPKLEDLVHRRVGGKEALKEIVGRSKRATDAGYNPLMIIDEPQYGASDPVPSGDDENQRKCVLAQIFDSIEEALGTTRESHWFIGLSATPFELNDLNRLWEVRQYLTEEYSGFNYFNGRPICEGVDIKPPQTFSLSTFSEQIKVPFLAKVTMSAYDKAKPEAFARQARKVGYDKTQSEYRADTEQALRAAIYAVLEQHKSDSGGPIGLCIRALNNNAKTDALILSLNLDPKRIEVIEYYGGEMTRKSVKRAVAERKQPDLPYVIFVTNRARMADAFPIQVRFFMDFGIKASDLNSLLQGLLGRACGYNKKSTVVLSDASAAIVEAYVATKGGYVHRTSRHSKAVGGFRRGAPTGMLKLRAGQDDDVVRNYFKRINAEVVGPNVPEGMQLSSKRGRSGSNRKGPILLIAEDLGLFDHIEDPLVRTEIFPEIPTGFKVARRGDTIVHSRNKTPLSYSVDEEGNCRYTFRWQKEAQGGAQGRAKGTHDSKEGQHMEPTIYIEKYDPQTGNVIDDKGDAEKKSGKWRAHMITFPLRERISEVRAATKALPIDRSPYSSFMTEEEKLERDAE